MSLSARLNTWRRTAPAWQGALVGGIVLGALMGLQTYVLTGRFSLFAVSMVGGLFWGLFVYCWLRIRKWRNADRERNAE